MASVDTVDALIVGAGLAGLTAARELSRAGLCVRLVESAWRPGGRIASVHVNAGLADTGAQFFTVRTEAFRRIVDAWFEAGAAAPWCRGFATGQEAAETDGHMRYRGAHGMRGLAEHVAHGLPIQFNATVDRITALPRAWLVQAGAGAPFQASAVVLTPPAPLSVAMLDRSDFSWPAATREPLRAISYAPCLALLLALDGPSRVPAPGGVQLADEPISWLADNRRKGISPAAVTLTIHGGPAFSKAHWEAGDAEIADRLTGAATPWIGSAVRARSVVRWAHSKPTGTYPDPCLDLGPDAPLVLAGDAFAGPRVEGAVLSGLAAARRVLDRRNA